MRRCVFIQFYSSKVWDMACVFFTVFSSLSFIPDLTSYTTPAVAYLPTCLFINRCTDLAEGCVCVWVWTPRRVILY